MFNIFKTRDPEIEQRLTRIDQIMHHSFRAVKNDMQNLTSWIHYLNQLNQKQQHEIQHLLTSPPKSEVSKERLSEAISSHPHLQFMQNGLTHLQVQMQSKSGFPDEKLLEISQKVSDLTSRVSTVEVKNETIWTKLDTISNQSTGKVSLKETRQHFKEKILKKITRHSKEYIGNMILSLIKKYERISAMNLREIIVEEQALCSKSSFYRFLEDIEKTGEVEVFQEGKEKFYLYKLVREV